MKTIFNSEIHNKNLTENIERPIVIHVNTEIDSTVSKNVISDISLAVERRQLFVPIVINSPGGVLYDFFAMVDVMQSVNIKVVTVVEGLAASGACMLAVMGDIGYRFMSPNSTMLLHEASMTSWGYEKMNDIEHKVEYNKHLNERMFKVLEDHIGQPNGFFNELIGSIKNADCYLTPQQAKEYKLIDHIAVPSLEAHLKIDYKLIW